MHYDLDPALSSRDEPYLKSGKIIPRISGVTLSGSTKLAL